MTASPPQADLTARDDVLARIRRGCELEVLRRGPIVVGVSGGADSVGLLHAIVHGDVLPPPCGGVTREIVVAHAEHDLRDEAVSDRDFVADLAARMGLRAVARRIPCREAARGSGEGVEATARRLRYAFLLDAAGAVGARAVLVAHTSDDQAETILHACLRGTGLAGLAGMPHVRELAEGIVIVRPLLDVGRADLRGYLRAAGEPWREDATNDDTRFARNFLRHEILARARRGPYPSAVDAIRRLGGHAATAAGALASAAGRLLDEHATRVADGSLVLDAAALAPLDRHLLAEVFVAAWRREDWPRRDMTCGHFGKLASLLRVAAGIADAESDRVIDLPGGIRADAETPGRVRLRRR